MAGLVGVAGTYVVFVLSPAGRALDDRLLAAAFPSSNAVYEMCRVLMRVAGPPSVVLLAFGLLAFGLLWRRQRVVVTGVACAGVLASAIVLKVLLVRPGDTLDNSFPSGHVAAAVALTLVVAGVSRGAGRVVGLVLGLALVVAVAVATMALQWHRPSDALGAVALGAFWWGVASITKSRLAERRKRGVRL